MPASLGFSHFLWRDTEPAVGQRSCTSHEHEAISKETAAVNEDNVYGGNMTSFSASTLEKKLSDLSNTQQSIQTISLWLIHHRKHAKIAVQVWYKQLQKGKLL